MVFNQFSVYTIAAQCAKKEAEEYRVVLGIIKSIEKCRSIQQVKTFLKFVLNIEECVTNYKLGTVGFLSTTDGEDAFKVMISYSDELITAIFPKKFA